MTVPFVYELRAGPDPIVLGGGDVDGILHLRVQLLEAWDTVRIEASPSEPVRAVKIHALERLDPDARAHDDYVIKFRGWEVLDEGMTLRDAGATDGSTFLVTRRRRRAVR